ncbi:alpha/beta hydrolase [Bacterioplanes sanyensis]|uniref:Alpha/beta hydrolase n=1 Tax=Bacterioplanes sanyensis TaxID=1249553 RepID=A0A222FMT9_9GAMM|nr:alpha/beta fold hydrolase [Bacterioplanes sanyensis]ASP39992.1 alpha/beta hydrolase [Bacterioplanes sanyensis]
MDFSPFSVAALRAAPQTLWIGQYKLEYQAFSQPQNRHQPAVIFLGGAFQSFGSFRHEVERVLSTHPVILLDLPSQGSNRQLAPELSLADYADLLHAFVQKQQLEQVILLGISYGSAMASIYASQHPQQVDKLLLSGITCFRRHSLITLLEDSLALLQQGEMDAFATTAVCNLINHSRLEQTEVSPTYRKLLYRQIARLDNNERARYAQNTQRLLDFTGFDQFPTVPTLVATGEFDNFTLPSENAAFASQCAQGQFAVIHNADHLAQFERREPACNLFHRFLCGESIDGIDGTSLYSARQFASGNRRLQGRERPLEQPYTLIDEASGKTHTVRISNINFAGCVIQQLQPDLALNEHCQHLYLQLPEAGGCFHIRILERERQQLRCLIIQRNLKQADQLRHYLRHHVPMIRQESPALDSQLA